MKARTMTWLTALALIAALALPGGAAAQHDGPTPYPYILIDLGTFGGPNAVMDFSGRVMSARGDVIADADTSTRDPYAPTCFNPDCYVSLGLLWQHGVRTTLESLPGGSSNAPYSINDNGLVVGLSQIRTIDPALGTPEARAVLWQNGQIVNLGTLPGGLESSAFAVNDRGLVAGPSSNGVSDPYGCGIFICWATQTRGFVWQDGVMQDMGTLGGPDALPVFMNDAGQIAGWSYTSDTPNPATGQPTMDLFLWQHGTTRDLGNLGGTLSTSFADVQGLNSRGEVVGQSDLPGDQSWHPVLWDGSRLVDLGTFGGNNGSAYAVGDAGEVAGEADLAGSQVHHGFLWKDGQKTDLPPVEGAPCSNGNGVNDRGQVVGNSTDCHNNHLAAMLWENGSAYDLNTLIAPSALHLVDADDITDRGEILGVGVFPNGDNRVVLLVPARLAASEGLNSNAPAPDMAGPASPVIGTHLGSPRCGVVPSWHARLARAFHRPCPED